jgi:DhnA family fructose-bisphosphate aldolase class Ia
VTYRAVTPGSTAAPGGPAGGRVATVSAGPPPEDLLAVIARQVDELREAGASVVLSPDGMAPHVVGTLSQQMPNGPLLVHVDVTKSLERQSAMLVQAFEFLFNEPVAT